MGSIHNEIGLGATFSKGVRRLLGLNDSEPGLERLSETVACEVNLFGTPEADFLLDRRMVGDEASVAPVAVSSSVVLLRNDNPDLLAIVLSASADLAYDVGVVANIAALVTGAAVAATPRGNPLDSRWRLGTGMQVSALQVLTTNATSPTGASLFGRRPANTLWTLPTIIGPGASFVLQSQAFPPGGNMVAEFQWLERKLLPGERGRFGIGA